MYMSLLFALSIADEVMVTEISLGDVVSFSIPIIGECIYSCSSEAGYHILFRYWIITDGYIMSKVCIRNILTEERERICRGITLRSIIFQCYTAIIGGVMVSGVSCIACKESI